MTKRYRNAPARAAARRRRASKATKKALKRIEAAVYHTKLGKGTSLRKSAAALGVSHMYVKRATNRLKTAQNSPSKMPYMKDRPRSGRPKKRRR